MMRIRWSKWVAVFLGFVLVLPARAGDSPLAQLPADTPILISLRGIQGTKERLAILIKNALLDLGPGAAAKMDADLDKALDGRKLAGLDPNGPVFLAFTS